MRRIATALLALASIGAASLTGPPPARAQDAVSPAEALVRLDIDIPGTARTARILGTERAGTGVLIDNAGLVLTIGYLMLEANAGIARFADGREYPVEPVAYDHETGFGLMRLIGAPATRALTLGRSEGIEPGAPLAVLSAHEAPSAGLVEVAARRTFAGYWDYLLPDAIFTQPAHPGFAGAALVDETGALVGIGSLFLRDVADEDSPVAWVPGNMFVPVDALKPILGDMLAFGRPSGPGAPWMGLTLAERAGSIIAVAVADDGPGERAGVEAGDVVIAIGDQPVQDLEDLFSRTRALGPAGTEIPLTLLRPAQGPYSVRIPTMDRHDWLRFDTGN